MKPHQLQGLIYLAVGNHGQKRRLFELHGESLPQRIVEYRIARLVVEIREDNGVSFTKCVGFSTEDQPRTQGANDHHGYESHYRRAPDPPHLSQPKPPRWLPVSDILRPETKHMHALPVLDLCFT